MPRRPTTTDAGLLAESYGERPYTVTLREEKAPGTNVLLDYTVAGGARRKRTLGYPVRRKAGRRWEWDAEALENARTEAEDRSAELRLARMREDALQADALTFGEAVALYADPDEGGLPPAKKSRGDYLRRLRVWSGVLGASAVWNAIMPARVTAHLRARDAEGKAPTGLAEVQTLRILYRWLVEQAGIDGLQDPTRGLKKRAKAIRDRHQPRQPRYTEDELRAVTRVRYHSGVDPRFPLFWAMAIDSGARSRAIRLLMRSMVDKPQEKELPPDAAPHGWVEFPPLKGQRPVLHLLTSFQRRELELAFDGYLRELEEAYRAGEVDDYPLFPGTRIIDSRVRIVHVGQARATQPCSETRPTQWLRDAEKVAKVEHVHRRGYHGVRRRVADRLYEEIGLDAMTTALGWSSRDVPERIYLEKRKIDDRVKAREANEGRRKDS